MALGLSLFRHTGQIACAVASAALVVMFVSMIGRAEATTFAIEGADQGLSNLGGSALAVDGAGDILLATEHGVYAYDGRRFVNLGPQQGLQDGGEVLSIAKNKDGRIALQYPSAVYVSDQVSDATHPITCLHFRKVLHPGISFYNVGIHRMVALGRDFYFLSGEDTVEIDPATARIESVDYDQSDRALLENAAAIFAISGHLWETFDDGRICQADPGSVRCYSDAEGLKAEVWVDLVDGGNGRVIARSAASVAAFDPVSHRWDVHGLPDQGAQYDSGTRLLGLYRTPDGQLITQAVHGLDVLGADGWRLLTVADGAPEGKIADVLTDPTGQLWFHILGRGLVRWVGYGRWTTVGPADGLSDGNPWETARTPDGKLWVSTDDGVDEVVGTGSSARVIRVFPVSAYALAATPDGRIWAGYREKGLREIDPGSGSTIIMNMPPVETVVPGKDGTVWIGSDRGLFVAHDGAFPPQQPVLADPLRTPIDSIKLDGRGGLYFLAGGRLHHRYSDGRDVTISGLWPSNNFEPLAMAIGADGRFWIGGPGGLYRLAISRDHVDRLERISTDDTRSDTIYAILKDHRGWIWVGTDRGISVYNGRHWMSVDSDDGLLSNDINEDGIREDPDGAVCIVTSHGVSRIRDPATLFYVSPLNVVVTTASVGSTSVLAGAVRFSRDPLLVELGTPNYAAERSVIFRYHLSGVDSRWVASTTGEVRYPFVPPGRHELVVVGYDELTHRMSAPVRLLIDMGYPWWRQSWAECLWVLALVSILYAGMRLRYRSLYARQAELVRRISEATAQIRHQAAHDEMTGLLVRREVERRLAERLSGVEARDDLVVALLDVDHFKTINDTCGHLGGDQVLQSLGRIIRRHLQDGEFAGRYGGEEVLLVLDDSNGEAAERVLNLHLAVRHDTFNAAGKPTRVTCSIGLAWAFSDDTWETLIGRADAALYEAKHGGRDRVVESRQTVRALNSE